MSIFILVLSGVIQTSSAVERDVNELPQLALAAWQCAVLAEQIDDIDPELHARLWGLGYQSATTYLTALNTEDEAITLENIPTLYYLNLSGPTVDFTAGVWWASTVEYTFDLLVEDESGERRDTALWPIVAERLFRERSCRVLR